MHKSLNVIQSSPFVCECETWMRKACEGEKFYKEKEGKRYCVLHYPGKGKELDFKITLEKKLKHNDFNFSGVWFPDYVDFTSVHFTAAADFNAATFSAAADFSAATFSAAAHFGSATFSADANFTATTFSADANFGYTNFSADAIFSKANFSAAASFDSTTFSAVAYFVLATFSAAADFNAATFCAAADFNAATFCAAADFNAATFSAAADFGSAKFSANANFSVASFSAIAEFRYTTFNANANFSSSTFKDYVYFAGSSEKRTLGDHPQLNLQFVHIEKPERVSLHTLNLQPHSFINVDSRKFEFIDVEFNYDLKEEIRKLNEIKMGAPHRLLAIACRQLADNAEANHRYREASRLRYSAFDARRKERFYGFMPGRLDWWYWLASGYGESVPRAFIIFAVLIGIFTIGYKNSGFDPTSKTTITKPTTATANISGDIPDTRPRRLCWIEAALYSFNVSILQKPEPKPQGLWGNALVSLETVLGPAQAALLALALRRRFMRWTPHFGSHQNWIIGCIYFPLSI